jgi:hypothetical protein
VALNQASKLIKKYGVSVDVEYPDGTLKDVKCIISKITDKIAYPKEVEGRRHGMFIPGDAIVAGCLVKERLTHNVNLALADFQSSFKTFILSHQFHMMVCNCTITVTRFTQTFDEFGNSVNTELPIITAQYAYLEVNKMMLKSERMGAVDNSVWRLYTPYADVSLLDTVTITTLEGDVFTVKVTATDALTYENIMIFDIIQELRDI